MARRTDQTSDNRNYLRPGGQTGVPTPGAGRTDGRLRQGDPLIPSPSARKTGR